MHLLNVLGAMASNEPLASHVVRRLTVNQCIFDAPRPCEIFGLPFEDVDFDASRLRIRHANGPEGRLEVSKTKPGVYAVPQTAPSIAALHDVAMYYTLVEQVEGEP